MHYEVIGFDQGVEDLNMIIEHTTAPIQIDDEDFLILDKWKFLTVQKNKKYQYAILYGERKEGTRPSRYLGREILGVKDITDIVEFLDGNGCNCKKKNMLVRKRKWNRKAKVNG